MLEQIEGSRAVARAVALCRPEVIPAYPISPQTHIVEAPLGDGRRAASSRRASSSTSSPSSPRCRSRSAPRRPGRAPTRRPRARGCCTWPRRSTTPPGLGLPIVMTVANRAIGAPINIWNDHSDSMSQRDSGWIQLYVESNQEAVDTHVLAFRLAEELSLPVMVCMDGFILTHAYERVDLPAQEQVDAFLPAFEPRQVLDPAEPVTIGAMVGPEAFTEVKYLAHVKQTAGARVDPAAGAASSREVARPRAAPASCAATAARTPRRSSSRSARCSGTIEDADRRAARAGRERRRARASRPSGRSRCREVRDALGSAGAGRRAREGPRASGVGGIVSQDVQHRARRRAARTSTP